MNYNLKWLLDKFDAGEPTKFIYFRGHRLMNTLSTTYLTSSKNVHLSYKSCFTALLTLSILFCIHSLHAQSISGRVLDSETREPVAFANVYFSNSTQGVATDPDGKFVLPVAGHERQEITVSYVGYASQTIDNYEAGKTYEVLLSPRARLLNEVLVYADTVPREVKVAMFLREFLGEKKGGVQCTIENIDEVRLVYMTSSNTLKAFSNVPLVISNKALGYRITYYLEEFTKDPSHIFYSGYSIFKDGTLDLSEREKRNIEKARLTAYSGSRMHFLRALWSGDVQKSNFKIFNIQTLKNETADKMLTSITPEVKSINGPYRLRITYSDRFFTGWVTEAAGVEFTKDGFAPAAGHSWTGAMASQRIADLLPYDYWPAGKSKK